MTKKQAHSELLKIESLLPYGSKARLAKTTRENRHNVQTAFRGMASERLTKKVLTAAQRLLEKYSNQRPQHKQ